MTYHPGKVIRRLAAGKEVKGSDDSVQAVLEMWDDNIFTFLVEKKISGEIKEGDVVLVDYRPEGKVPVASQKVVKVLKGKTGKDVWDFYKDFHTKRQRKSPQTSTPMPQPSYMG